MELSLKRQRTVEGGCWPCKKRRIKCDLAKPACRRCILSGGVTSCNYQSLNLRWRNIRRVDNAASSNPKPIPTTLSFESLATNEKRALDYFIARLWPLLSTAGQPCAPPVSLVSFKPVLQTICVFADSHRALQENMSERNLTHRRLTCLSSIRHHLQDIDRGSLSPLLTAVILLYFLDGFVDCTQNHASTQCHHAGVMAILNELGGFQKARAASSKATSMLLSEFATTDLTGALLQGREPYLPATIWNEIELQPVWWEVTHCIPKSLASILGTISEMSFYLHSIGSGERASPEKVAYFERILQPTYLVLGDAVDMDSESKHHASLTMATYSFCRAFQHAALIYLYRALCSMPTSHALVQQHVHACLESIRGVDFLPEVQKCVLFPLFVAGGHALTDASKAYVTQKLDNIYKNLRFESVICIRSSLNDMWKSSRQSGTWSDTFQNFTGMTTLVL